MLDLLYKQPDLSVFERIIKDDLSPLLQENIDIKTSFVLIQKANKRLIFNNVLRDEVNTFTSGTDFTVWGYNSIKDIDITIVESSNPELVNIYISPKKAYKFKEKMELPPPPDELSRFYLEFLQDEFERVKIRANKISDDTIDVSKIPGIVKRNNTRLKQLIHDSAFLFNEYYNDDRRIINNPNSYIFFILQLFLLRIKLFYCKKFKEFCPTIADTEESLFNEFLFSIPALFRYPEIAIMLDAKETNKCKQIETIINKEKQKENKLKEYSNYLNANQNLIVSEKVPEYKKSIIDKPEDFVPDKIKCNSQINALVGVFYQLSNTITVNGEFVIETSRRNLAKHISNIFTDKYNNDLCINTIDTILRPSKYKKRPHPNSDKNIDVFELLLK